MQLPLGVKGQVGFPRRCHSCVLRGIGECPWVCPLWEVSRLEQSRCGAQQFCVGESVQRWLTSFPGTSSRCIPAVTRALPVDPLPTTPDWPSAPTHPAGHTGGPAEQSPFPALGTRRGRDGLRQRCCPVPRQGQGATAPVPAGPRVCPVPRWGFCFVSSNKGEEATLHMPAWAQFFALGLCWKAPSALCDCGL